MSGWWHTFFFFFLIPHLFVIKKREKIPASALMRVLPKVKRNLRPFPPTYMKRIKYEILYYVMLCLCCSSEGQYQAVAESPVLFEGSASGEEIQCCGLELHLGLSQVLPETLRKPCWKFLSQLPTSSSAVVSSGCKYSENVLS